MKKAKKNQSQAKAGKVKDPNKGNHNNGIKTSQGLQNSLWVYKAHLSPPKTQD